MSIGRTVVVSGAGSGIGRAVAGRLVADGFHVTAVGRRKEPLDDLAAEHGPCGGTANVVAPGFVPDTGFWAGRLTPESRQRRAGQTLTGREGAPSEVASLIAWLLGPDGGWMTGQVLSPNGGVVLGR